MVHVENTWDGYTKAYLFVQGYHEQPHGSTYVPRPVLFGTVAICTFGLRLRYSRAVAGTEYFDQVLLRPRNAVVLVLSEAHDHLYDDDATTAEEDAVHTTDWMSYKD